MVEHWRSRSWICGLVLGVIALGSWGYLFMTSAPGPSWHSAIGMAVFAFSGAFSCGMFKQARTGIPTKFWGGGRRRRRPDPEAVLLGWGFFTAMMWALEDPLTAALSSVFFGIVSAIVIAASRTYGRKFRSRYSEPPRH